MQWNSKAIQNWSTALSSDRKLCCSPLFFENCEILEKIVQIFVKLWEKKKLLWGSERHYGIGWRTMKLWELRCLLLWDSPYLLREKNLVYSSARQYLFLGTFCVPTLLGFHKRIIYRAYSFYQRTTCSSIILCPYCHIAYSKIFKHNAVKSRYSGRPSC